MARVWIHGAVLAQVETDRGLCVRLMADGAVLCAYRVGGRLGPWKREAARGVERHVRPAFKAGRGRAAFLLWASSQGFPVRDSAESLQRFVDGNQERAL